MIRFRKLALSVLTVSLGFLLTACGGSASRTSSNNVASNNESATTALIKKSKQQIKDGQLSKAKQTLEKAQHQTPSNTEVKRLLSSVQKLSDADDALKSGNVTTAKAKLAEVPNEANNQEINTKSSDLNQQANQIEKANTLFSTVQINLNQKNIGAAQNANDELQAMNSAITKVAELKKQATELIQGYSTQSNGSDSTVATKDQSEESSQSSSSSQATPSVSNQEMTTVLDSFRAASGITANAETQFNLSKLSTDIYQIDVKNGSATDNSNPAGTYRYNVKSGVVQKMNPETGSFGGR